MTLIQIKCFSHCMIFFSNPNLRRYALYFKYPTIDRVQNIGTNLLLMHGTADSKVPVQHSRDLLVAALKAKDLNETSLGRCSTRDIGTGTAGTELRMCATTADSKVSSPLMQDARKVRLVEITGVDHNGVHRYILNL